MTTYKITYEHSSNGDIRTEDTLLECEHEPTKEELEHAVSWDSSGFTARGWPPGSSYRLFRWCEFCTVDAQTCPGIQTLFFRVR